VNRYCHSCFRELDADESVCRDCRDVMRSSPKVGGASVFLGLIGITLVVAGVVYYQTRYCVIGATLLIVAVLLHIVRILR